MALPGSVRDWYLGALGIVRYIPRETAPQIEDAPALQEEPLAPASSIQPPQGEHHHQRLRRELEAGQKPGGRAPPPSVEAEKASPEVSAPVDTEARQIVQFRLAFWQPCDDMVVLNALPLGERPTPQHLTMLSRLLAAIHRLPDNRLPAFDLVDWPQAPGASSTLGDAREFVSVFLDAKAFLKPFAHILLMGETAALVAAPEGEFRVGSRALLGCGAEAICVHSLHDMTADPSLKAPTWDAIKFLAGQ